MVIKEIIENAKKGSPTSVSKIIENRVAEANDEYELVKLNRLIEEEKRKLEEAKNPNQSQRTTRSVVGDIMAMAQVDPQKAKQFLDGLDEESIQKLATIMAAESGKADALMNLMRSPGTDVKSIIEIVKLIRPEGGGGSDLKAVAEVFKLGMDASKQNAPTKSPEEIIGTLMEKYILPFYQGMQAKDKEMFDLRLSQMEQRIVDPLEWQKQQKAIISELGYVPASSAQGGKTSVDIQLEDMRQSHDLDMQKINWEMRKHLLDQQADREKWDRITETFSPIFQMAAPEVQNQLRTLGASMGKSMQNPNPQPQAQQEMALFQCPNCKTEQNIPVPPGFQGEIKVRCIKCGTITPAGFGETPSESTASAEARVEEPPQSIKLRPTYR